VTAPLPSPNWQPSPVRTIAVPTATNLRARSLVPLSVAISWAPKSSADNLDFTLDPTAWLAETDDYLASVSAAVPTATGLATDLTVSWATIIAGAAVLFLGGGAPGTSQTVDVTLTTRQARVLNLSIVVAITLASAATAPDAVPTLTTGVPVPPNALRLPNGNILTNASGQPFLIA